MKLLRVIRREGEYGDVPIKILVCLRLVELKFERLAASDLLFGVGQLFGGILRSDAGTAQVPSALDIEADFQPQSLGLVERINKQVYPLLTAELRPGCNTSISPLVVTAGIDNRGSLKMAGFHRFEVAFDGFAGHVSVEPPPPAVYSILLRRLGEVFLQKLIICVGLGFIIFACVRATICKQCGKNGCHTGDCFSPIHLFSH